MKKILEYSFLTSAAVHCSSIAMMPTWWMNECAWFIRGLGHMDLSNILYVKAPPLSLRNLGSPPESVGKQHDLPYMPKVSWNFFLTIGLVLI